MNHRLFTLYENEASVKAQGVEHDDPLCIYSLKHLIRVKLGHTSADWDLTRMTEDIFGKMTWFVLWVVSLTQVLPGLSAEEGFKTRTRPRQPRRFGFVLGELSELK